MPCFPFDCRFNIPKMVRVFGLNFDENIDFSTYKQTYFTTGRTRPSFTARVVNFPNGWNRELKMRKKSETENKKYRGSRVDCCGQRPRDSLYINFIYDDGRVKSPSVRRLRTRRFIDLVNDDTRSPSGCSKLEAISIRRAHWFNGKRHSYCLLA